MSIRIMLKGETVCGLLYFLAVCPRLVPAFAPVKIEEEPYVRFVIEGNYTAAVGSNFTAECRSNYPITLVRRSERNVAVEEYSVDNGYSNRLHFERLTYEDVGWIDCVQTFSPSYKASFYLFVDDPVHLMVGPRVTRISGKVYNPVAIPCTPTSPDVTVNLLTSKGDPIPFSTDPKDENMTKFYYDPARGIILPGTHRRSYWYIYICEFTKRGVKQRKYVDLMLDGGDVNYMYLERQDGKETSVVNAKSGTDVKFVVEVFTTYYRPLFYWYDSNNNDIKTGTKYTTAHVFGEPGETRLIIHNISSSDAGSYTVKNYQPFNVVHSIMFTLHIQDVPRLDIEMEKVFLVSNDNFVAFCRDKSPRLYRELTWTIRRYNCQPKDGCEETVSSLKTSQDVEDIEFNPMFPYAILLKKPVRANITCAIKYLDNTEDIVTRPLILSEAKDGFEIKFKFKKDITTRTVVLTCTVSRFLYSDNLYWIGHDGFVIENNRTEDGRNLTITRSETIYSYLVMLAIEMNADYTPLVEEYRCMAVDYQYTPSFKSHILDINSGVAPHFLGGNVNNGSQLVMFEEDLMLRCHPGGVPSPTLHWYKDKTKLENDGRWFLALHLGKNDTAGRYACRITNDFGEDYVYMDVEVYYPVPVSFNDSDDGWILEERVSERVTLLCTGDGEPTPNVTWFRDNDKLHESSSITIEDYGAVLSIFPVQDQDSGFYTCRHDIESHKEQLIVDDSPSIVGPVLGSIFAVVLAFAVIYIGLRIRHLNRLNTPISYHSLLSMRK